MAWNVAGWPWETIHGECVQRDEIAKLFFDAVETRFTEIKPSSKSWTKDWLEGFSDLIRGRDGKNWDIYSLAQKLPKVMGALNLEETTLIRKKTYKAIIEKKIVSKPWSKYERPIGENQK